MEIIANENRGRLLAELAAAEKALADFKAEFPRRFEEASNSFSVHQAAMLDAGRELETLRTSEANQTARTLNLRRELENEVPAEIVEALRKIRRAKWNLENNVTIHSGNRAEVLEQISLLGDAERTVEEMRFQAVENMPEKIIEILERV
jgi:hypothetical protein